MISVLLVLVFGSVSSQVFNPNNTVENGSSLCKQSGYTCNGCDQVVLCVQNGANFTAHFIATCGGNSSCFNGVCDFGPNPNCDPPVVDLRNMTFECRTTGMYPDPFDAHVFHHCVKTNNMSCSQRPLEHFEDRCDCDHVYNVRTTFCDIPVKLHNGNSPIPYCEHQGQSGLLWENPTLYYVCQYHPSGPLYPFQYRCENGKYYNSYLMICEDVVPS